MASKKNQEQKDFNKLMQEEIALKQKEKSLQESLVNMAKARYKISNDAKKIQQDLTAELLESKSTEEQIQAIQSAKDKLIQEAVSKGKEINKAYFERLNTQQTILEKLKEEEDIQSEIEEITKGAKDELMGSLGTLGEMLTAGTALAAAMALFKGLTEGIGKAFENTIGQAVKLNQELGISSAQALEMGFQNLAPSAIFSRFSIEQLNQATEDLATTLGTTAGISNDLRNSVAELSAMGVGGEQAAMLAQSFESASGSAVDMNKEIKEMANDAGVMASVTFKDLAAQQRFMLGATKEEIKELAKKTIELNKQGLSLDKMKGISEKMMDIEGTMRAQAKARVILQDKLNDEQKAGMQGMTAAALEFQRTGNFDALRESLDKAGMSAEEFNKLGPRGQELYAEAIGMSADELAEQIRKQEQMAKFEKAGVFGEAAKGLLETYERIPGGIKEATTGLIAFIAQMAIMNTMQGKGTGLSNLNPMNMFKKGGGGDIQTEVPGSDQTGQASQGSGGGLKSLAEGLREMGDGKVFAGIGAVALAGPAFIVALPSIPFLLFMGLTPLKQLETNFSGLGKGLAEMPQGALGAAVMMLVGPALALGTLAIPFLLFMSIPGIGPLMQVNFTALATGLAAFGNPATAVFVLIGIGLMAALGVAMIPFAFALGLLTPLLEAFGNIVVNVMSAIPPIIGAIADGFVTMMGAVSPENVLGLMMLGPALLSASVGMIAFSAALAVGGIASFFGGGIIDEIKELSQLGPNLKLAGDGLADISGNVSIISGSIDGLSGSVSQLNAVGTGLMGVSGALAAMAFSGLLAMPIIGALIGLAAVAPALEGLGSFFGIGGDDEGGDSDSELLNEIKGLRSDLQTQPIMLTIDGKAVQSISRVQSRQSKSTRGFS